MDHWLCELRTLSEKKKCLWESERTLTKVNGKIIVVTKFYPQCVLWDTKNDANSVREWISANEYYHRNRIYWIKCGDSVNEPNWTDKKQHNDLQSNQSWEFNSNNHRRTQRESTFLVYASVDFLFCSFFLLTFTLCIQCIRKLCADNRRA